jgi:hypothetical protein
VNQPLRGPESVGGSIPVTPSGRAGRGRVEPSTAPAPPAPAETLEAPTSGRLRAAAQASPPTSSAPASLERAKARLATGFYHSPEGMQAMAGSLLGAQPDGPGVRGVDAPE